MARGRVLQDLIAHFSAGHVLSFGLVLCQDCVVNDTSVCLHAQAECVSSARFLYQPDQIVHSISISSMCKDRYICMHAAARLVTQQIARQVVCTATSHMCFCGQPAAGGACGEGNATLNGSQSSGLSGESPRPSSVIAR